MRIFYVPSSSDYVNLFLCPAYSVACRVLVAVTLLHRNFAADNQDNITMTVTDASRRGLITSDLDIWARPKKTTLILKGTCAKW